MRTICRSRYPVASLLRSSGVPVRCWVELPPELSTEFLVARSSSFARSIPPGGSAVFRVTGGWFAVCPFGSSRGCRAWEEGVEAYLS